jgi:hypothetical protein
MIAALGDRVLSIGADSADSSELRFRKRLLVGIALFILPIGFLWGCLYWVVGEEAVALTPWAYVAGSIISLAVFARNRNFAFLRTAQFLLILVAPALGMIMLGGLEDSSFVILWSLLAPLGAVAFDRPARAWPWFAAFVAVVLLTVVISEVVRPDGANLPDAFVRTFDVLNIVAVSLVAMLLLITFARGRDTAQARVEALLLNILPKDVAQRLQAEPQAIADHFDNTSILFADVVNSLRLRADSTRARWSGCSVVCSRLLTNSSTATRSRRSRRSAIATWLRRGFPGLGPTTRTRLPTSR